MTRAQADKDSRAKTASKDFDKRTIAHLLSRGIRITGTTWLPGTDGTYANGERGYILDDNGCQRIRNYAGVLLL